MLKHLLALCALLKSTSSSFLQHPSDPYVSSMRKNYIYERACYHHAMDHSFTRYESDSLNSKLFDSLYPQCLSVIWPRCEVMKGEGMIVMLRSHETFEKNKTIVHQQNLKAAKYAHKRGFFVENLLMPQHRCFIFWDPFEPAIDVSTFYTLNFPDSSTLLMLRSLEIVKTIKRLRERGAESTEQLYLIASVNRRKFQLVMKFEQLADIVKTCLNGLKSIGMLTSVSQGDITPLQKCINQSIPKGKVGVMFLKANTPTERIQLLHPFYTPVLSTPLALQYEPSEMLPMLQTFGVNNRSFIPAAFDKNGNLVEYTAKNIASYLVMGFYSIILV
jgi:hypothetical protein